jgi:HK97 family phage portal protein
MFNKLFNKPQESQLKNYTGATVGQYFSCFTDMYNISPNSYLNNGLQTFLNDFLLSPALNKVVNSIANKAISIDPVIKDLKNDKFIYNHDFLKLLNRPNPFEDKRNFEKTSYCNQLLTGNSFLNVVGSFSDKLGNKPPLELQTLNPVFVNPQSNGLSGYPTRYQYNHGKNSIEYNYDVIAQKYLSEDGNEILHQRDFNPNYGSNCLLGSSRVQAIQLEIEQYLQASIHNYSLLKNQGRPSGMVTADDDSLSQIQPEQQDLIKDQIREIKGAQNAGKIAMLPFKLKWQSLSENIKDMDFKSLKEMTEACIYKAFDYPLTFIDEKSSTMNNKNIARLDLYDNAILPLVKWRNEFYTNKILRTRYKNSENLILTYDEFTIEALRERKLQDAERKDKLNKFSANEIRRDLGDESFVGGDTVYQPANLVPIGQDRFTADNRETPAKNFEREYYIKQMTKKGYKLEEIEKDLDNLHD